MPAKKNVQEPIYIVDGLRTPFVKAGEHRGPFSAADLGTYATRALLARQNLNPSCIEEVVAACVMPSEDEANIARIIGLRAGVPQASPAFTVARNCGAGLQALDSAWHSLRLGRSSCALVVATEAMSRAPLIVSPEVTNWMLRLSRIKTLWGRMMHLASFPLSKMSPIVALKHGLTDPLHDMIMGKTAEEVAYQYGISRADMDLFALESHQKAQQAWEDGVFSEVIPLIGPSGVVERDTGIRPDLSLMKLSKLRAAFEPPFGTITAGNSSQITDGAAALLLATESFVEKYQLEPLGVLRDLRWSGCDPVMMGLGPVRAMSDLMQHNQLSWNHIDVIEINEAFSAQVLGVIKSFQEPDLGRQFCQLSTDHGPLPIEKLNPCGGAIALGHPIAASGLRLVLRALTHLKTHGQHSAITSLCIGGGQGGAAWLESCEKRGIETGESHGTV